MAMLNLSIRIPHLFHTYQVPKNQTFNCMIWEAACATSTTPAFFKHIVIGESGTSQPYIDGSIGCNNPIAQVLEEAKLMFPNQQVACIIGIGTGHADTISILKPCVLQ